MPKTAVKELSQKQLNKSLEKSLARVKKMLKGKWENEPGTTASWEIREGRDRAGGSKDAADDARIGSEYGRDELEGKPTSMEDVAQEGEMAEEEWQEGDRILGPGKTETPDTPKEQPKFARKSAIKKSIKKAMNKAIKKALKKAAKAEGRDEREEEEEEREERKVEKSMDMREADIAVDASPFLRRMSKKQKKLQKSMKKHRKAVKKLSKLEKAHAGIAVASMELSKSVARQPMPVGSMLRKSGGSRAVRGTYDPSSILRKSQDLVIKGKMTTLDGIKVEEWVNGIRADLPENLRALFGPSAN